MEDHTTHAYPLHSYSLFISDGRPARRVKLLVLGPEGVGKTSLIECLRGIAIQPRTSLVAAPGGKGEEKKKTSVLGSLATKVAGKEVEKKGADLRVVAAPPRVEAIDISPISTSACHCGFELVTYILLFRPKSKRRSHAFSVSIYLRVAFQLYDLSLSNPYLHSTGGGRYIFDIRLWSRRDHVPHASVLHHRQCSLYPLVQYGCTALGSLSCALLC